MLWRGAEKKTALAPKTDQPRRDLVEAYEGLRQRALAGDYSACTGGLGILVVQGMGAWIEVCSQLLPDPPARSSPLAATDSPPRLAGTIERELVTLMTQMILSTSKEQVA